MRHTLQEMNGKQLQALCYGKQWVKVRKFLDSDSTNKDKKREFVCYQGGGGRLKVGGDDMTSLHKACFRRAPPDIIKSLLNM